ncbi:ABC transporter permease [Flavobacterium silvaticum]|uniref:ABC transporter permease n=1 Tax=Flavobacterium silvaticum TaxID=1852020 RepID=A0A972JJD6_9FLAO|nr:ABC transporter permease [Flavobacterium silvaticum]NMH29248.1 ABC transporter permease [Flavobacterium silvaticum]
MKRLISIELQKLWQSRASRVLIIIYFSLLFFMALLGAINIDFGNIKLGVKDLGILNFPIIWHITAYLASWFKLFLAIVIISMIANEYSYGTLKQNLIDGLTKKEFIASKGFTVLLLSGTSTLFVFVITLVLGYSFSSFTETSIVFSRMEYLPAYFLKLAGFYSICLFAGILVKRSAFALGAIFVWWIIEKLMTLALWFIFHSGDKIDAFSRFFPLESMSNLIDEPFTKIGIVRSAGQAMGVPKFADPGVSFLSMFIVLCWIVIFVLSSYRLLQKRDL